MLFVGANCAAAEPAPPRERDCARWAEASWTARPAVEPPSAASGIPSAYADRAPNPDPMLVCGDTVVLYAMWKARDGALRWWLVAGVAAGV